MKTKLALFTLLLALGCQQEMMIDGTSEKNSPARSHKIVNPSTDAISGMIAIKAKDGQIPDISGIKGVTAIEKAFPDVPGKEERHKEFGLDRWYIIYTEENISLEQMATDLSQVSAIDKIQFGKTVKLASDCKVIPCEEIMTKASSWAPFDDPLVGKQWHYCNIGDLSIAPTARKGADVNVKPAWRFCTGDPSIVVAVLDEAVCYNHPDLERNIWTNTDEIPDNGIDDDKNGYVDDVHGHNFVTNGQLSWGRAGDSGHGTHIAGTIAAVNNNGTGVCGIAGGDASHPGVKIMSCQLYDGGQTCNDLYTAKAFIYAADNGASIVQCSWGYNSGVFKNDEEFCKNNPLTVEAIEYFLKADNCPNLKGSVAIFAAGNEGKGLPGYPAGYYKNISVASIASDNLPACYTNYGPGTNIAAPGGELTTGGIFTESGAVLSTLPFENSKTGYGYMQGTSMACPHVTGVAALGLSYMIQRGIKMDNNEFMSKLLTSVNDIDNLLIGEKSMYNNSIRNWENQSLTPYRKNMGTGTIDTWRFFMQIDGTPCLTAKVGESQRLDITDYFGGCAANLTYLEVSISQEDKEELGLETDPEIAFGKLKIHPTKPGAGIVNIKAIAGGDKLGDGGVNLGGIELNRAVSIIARPIKASNGGWL